MKRILFFALLLCSLVTLAQEVRTNIKNEFVQNRYATDIVINSTPDIDQRDVKLAVAFNGWLYAAYTKVDAGTNSGGITIMYSTDNGVNWSQFDSYMVPGYRYTAFDIVVAGTSTADLKLYLVGVNHNLSLDNYTLYIDTYDAVSHVFIGSPFNESKGNRKIYDISMATDYLYPAVGADPYSVAVVYSIYSSSNDSINYIASTNGGSVWDVKQNIATTGSFFRKVSLAYGRSNSASNGRYFAAWEQLGSSVARTGHIYTSRSSSQIISPWITPVNLDSTSSTMINLCRNPSIAVQYNNMDNDSGSVSAVVLVDRDYSGNGSDYDLLGFYNNRAHFTNYWYRLDIVNSNENDMFPDVSYDPVINNFLAVYFDSTNTKIPYIINGMNLTSPSSWTTINGQINDASNLSLPFPRVEINPVYNQVAHVWIADGTGINGVAMFDAEYSSVNIQNSINDDANISIYPNPVSDHINISIVAKSKDDITIKILDMTGKVIYTQISGINKGSNLIQIDRDNIASGIYFVNIIGANINTNSKIVVK
jgi:hypothetical protein